MDDQTNAMDIPPYAPDRFNLSTMPGRGFGAEKLKTLLGTAYDYIDHLEAKLSDHNETIAALRESLSDTNPPATLADLTSDMESEELYDINNLNDSDRSVHEKLTLTIKITPSKLTYKYQK